MKEDEMKKTRPIPALTDSQSLRFWERVDLSTGQGPNGECWEWTGYKNPAGYGQVSLFHRPCPAHRVSWTLENGPIPDGMCVLHRCDNPACVHPDHLWIGTLGDNNNDRHAKGRSGSAAGNKNGTHTCPETVSRGERHHEARFTEAQIVDIRKEHAAGGVTTASLARRYGVWHNAMRKILERRSWTHV